MKGNSMSWLKRSSSATPGRRKESAQDLEGKRRTQGALATAVQNDADWKEF
jgi:hypothetical protein